ncbi:uncharacterized protein LOC129565992 [Sitodiplosis mosellana]|uniref:uncharacterized protein LOC129565992 n=1 Tax=Sitodiplosis mosellana TaxID=263140 RepID=UPI0024440D00|nr:uncharacterized protein LOC129565992 [Sitodiplosis mosellana]
MNLLNGNMLFSNIDSNANRDIPPNLIATDSTEITAVMLPLITLSQAEIDIVVKQVPGGVANIQDIYGLTPLQHGILFHHMMDKQGDSYVLVRRVHFTNREALERYTAALQKLIERHDILRTLFIWKGLNEPVQVVLRQVPSILTEFAINDTEKPVLKQFSYQLDLTQAPLLRLLVAPTSDGGWVALKLMHHLIGDNVTLERLYTEMQTIIDGRYDQLTMPIPYRNMVALAHLGVSQDEHTRFFTGMLADIDEPTFPFGLSDVGQDGAEISGAQLKLPQTLNNQLRMVARKIQVSQASICHLAWAQVLARASGREAVVFGTVLSSCLQIREENNNIVGPMINALPIRININDADVETAVRHTHARLSQLLAHQHATLMLAQRCSGVPTGLPLFTTLLNYVHNKKAENLSPSLNGISVINEVEVRTNYPLALSVEDDGDSLDLMVQIISPISPTRICAYMQQALESLADALTHDSQQPVRRLTVIPPEERALLLHGFNPTDVAYSPARCLHQLFEMQVEFDAQAVAVECNGEFLSYSELNAQANQLAHYLIAKGVNSDDLIGLCAEPSITMIVAMLGILKAGGAYVPLDPAYPSQRLTNILQDANPKFLLADATGQKALGDHQVPVVDLCTSLPADLSIDNPDAVKLGVTPSHLAYVIYTSGSTGTPKGVMVEHQHVVQQMVDNQNTFDFNKQDKMCVISSMGFDSSVWEIWSAFFIGCQLSIVPFNIIRSADKLYEWICASGITVLSQTPSAFKMLMRAENISSRSHKLRYIILGGEAFDPLILRDWHEKNPESQTVLVNMYGPTETIIDATSWICDIETSEKLLVVPIGRPLPSYRIYLLDAYGDPVPLGAEGEMYVGGVCVARGYLNRSELTAERFLPDPYSDNPAARMYRSGDRARHLPDGNLIYMGRIDQQVKIRGFRIELGEIEARLVEHHQVHEAVVNLGDESDARLVAYVVADADSLLAQNLRSYLSKLLPDYMVPAAYVCLPSLPLTPNGKLDRRALPPPNDEAFATQPYEAPQNAIEELLAVIWCKLLGIKRISRNDSFFELGGNSFLVMQLINQAKLQNIHINARGIFSFPVLKDLALEIIDVSNRLYCEFAIPVRQSGNQTPIFMLPSGDGDIAYAFELAHRIDERFPVYMLPWPSPDKKQPSSMEEMATRMVDLIKNVQPNGPCAIIGYCTGGILGYEIANQLLTSRYPVSFLGFIDTYSLDAIKPNEDETEAESFLNYLAYKCSEFDAFNELEWWIATSKMTLNEAIEEVKKTNINLKRIDVEWEALFSKQCDHYQDMCIAYKIHSLPLKVHLFKAMEYGLLHTRNEFLNINFQHIIESNKAFYDLPKLGWENSHLTTEFHVIPVNGDHLTLMSEPANRISLADKIAQLLLANECGPVSETK